MQKPQLIKELIRQLDGIKNMKKFFKIFSFIRYIFDRLTGFRYKVISPLCTKDEYLEIFQTAKNREYKTIKNYFSYDYNKIKIWIDDLALVTQVVKKQSDINYQHGFVFVIRS